MNIQGIHKPHRLWFPFSPLTAGFCLFIIASATWMRQLTDVIRVLLGSKTVDILIQFSVFSMVISYMLFMLRVRRSTIKVFMCIVLLGSMLWGMRYIKIPIEKIHLIEYGVLGWLSARDIRRFRKRWWTVAFAYGFCLMVAIIDELFQKILPYRFFDFRDIVLNGIGAFSGICAWWLNKKDSE